MERRVNYLLVGIFSLVLVAGFIAFVLWAHHRGNGKTLTTYNIYFNEAVNGLALGGSVRYLGVEAGHIQGIDLDTQAQPPRVRITVGIDGSIPITQGTVATLKPSGITGVSFIDLHTDPADTAPLVVADNQPPVIRSESSGFDQLFNGASDTMQRLNLLLSDENIAHISKTFNSLDNISHRFDMLLEKHDAALNRFFGPNLDELSDTIEDAHDTIDSFKTLSDSLNKHPSQLIFGK